VKWSSQNTFSNKIEVNASVRTIGASVAANSDQSVLNVLIPGSTLGINNAVRATLFVTDIEKNIHQRQLLATNNWKDIYSVINKRTENKVFISVIDL